MCSGSEKNFVAFTDVHSVNTSAADSLMKNLFLVTVLYTITVLALSPLYSSAQAAQVANVVDYGATPDDDTDDTQAFEAALEASREIYIPQGTFIAEVNITSSNTVIRSSGTVKARDGAKHIFNIRRDSGWVLDCIIEGGILDMSGMADANTSSALFLNFTWGNRIANIRVINQPTDASAVWLEDSVYTTLFENLEVGSTTGRITVHGKSYINQAVTTCTFTSCVFGQARLSDTDGITFISPVVQGSLDKFIMKNASNISIYSGDIEGGGIFLRIESNVNNIYSIGNSLSGFTGTYRQGAIEYRYVLMDDYSFSNNTFSLSDGSSIWSDASFSIYGAGTGIKPKLYVQNPPGHFTAWLADFNNLQDLPGNNGLRVNILNKDSKIASFCSGNIEIASIDGWGNLNLSGDLNLTGQIKTTASANTNSIFNGISVSAYASGQNHILDTTPSPLDFSLTDPCIVIPAPGTWLITFNAAIDCNKATYSSRVSRDLKLSLYRANNNPGYLDLNKAVAYSTIPVIRKYRGTLAYIGCNYIYHTAESDDLIQVYGSVSTLPRKGGAIGIGPPTSLIAIKLD